jgi:nitrite reductase (NADH) large subunit
MKVVIIGNGVAGVTAAETIRADDKKCEIIIFSDERYPFYSRPRLIELLAGKVSVEQITIHAQSWYAANNVQLELSCRVAVVDTVSKNIRDHSGTTFTYDTLVIAVGASCLVPPVPGIDADSICTLRTIDDAEKIRALAVSGKRAAVIGGGLLGIEVANSLSARGVTVEVLEVFDRLLPRQLDREGSVMIRRLLELKGLAFHTGAQVELIEKKDWALAIRCRGGKTVKADFAVVSAGIRPNTAVALGAPIERKRGIIVDRCMRTSVPGVYACGDCAEYGGTVYGLWQPAREQGMTCGAHILGKESAYKGSVNSARLKVAGIELASIGELESSEGVQEVVEKDDNAGIYKKLFTRDGRLVGAILIGNVREAAELQRSIAQGEELTE